MSSIYKSRRFIAKFVLLLFSYLSILSVIILLPIERSDLAFENKSVLKISTYVLCIIAGVLITIFSVMQVSEYFSHFRALRNDTYHAHRMNFEQVIENESRKKLIETILKEPGIHYNALRKKCNLQPGQFRWHIDVLLNYKIIKREKRGYNVVFFPSFGEYDHDIEMVLKFPLRDNIYQIIENNPGIILSDIARELDIPNQRNKVKYHVDKLISADLLTVVKSGRKKELFLKKFNRKHVPQNQGPLDSF